MSIGEAGRIGPYEVRSILGRGGSAIVYRAYDPALNREVAIKALTLRPNEEELLRKRFQRESLAIARLRHPNILTIYSTGEEYGVPYIVMEYYTAGSLTRRLGQPLALTDAARVVQHIGSALDYAHDQGLLHRDVKPANIFIEGDRAILADFGIVKAITGDVQTNLTQTGLTVGTPEYIAPEQALGERLDGRADLYALAVVLYEMVTGTPPFTGRPFDVLNAHVEGKIPDPRLHNPRLTAAVSRVLLKALGRYPEGRYPTGAALAKALDQAITQGDLPGSQPLPLAADREARTRIIDLPPERLTDTHPEVVQPRLQGADTQSPAAIRPLTGNTDSTLPPLPDLTPASGTPTIAAPENLSATPGATESVQEWQPPTEIATPAPGIATSAPPSTNNPVEPIRAVPYIGATPPAPPRPPWWLFGIIGVVVLLLLGGGGWLALRQFSATTTPTATTVANAGTAVPTSPVVGIAATPTSKAVGTPAISTPADPAAAQIAAGDQALQDGKFTEAVASYRAALETNPNSAAANRQLGLTLWIWNHEAGEIDYLDRATKLDPNDALAWAYLSFSAVDTHQVERAYAAAQQAVRVNPEAAEGFAAVANTYLRYPPDTSDPTASLHSAEEAINRARALDPKNLWTLWFYCQFLQEKDQNQEALGPIDEMIVQRPNWATLYYAKGGIYRSLDQDPEARLWQERALALDPEYPYALTEMGWLEYDAKNYQRAIELFQQALNNTDDTNNYAHVGLGWTLAALGDYAHAIPHCERAIQIDSRSPIGYECLGSAYLEGMNNYASANTNYRKVIELRPQWESGYIGIARVYNAQKNYAESEAILRQGLQKITTPRYINYWLGLALYRQQHYDRAQPEFERAVQLKPENAVLQYWLGANLEQLGRYAEARTAYERALALDPNYQDPKDALERLRTQGH